MFTIVIANGRMVMYEIVYTKTAVKQIPLLKAAKLDGKAKKLIAPFMYIILYISVSCNTKKSRHWQLSEERRYMSWLANQNFHNTILPPIFIQCVGYGSIILKICHG